jgi:hypothetical protein
MGSFDQCNRSPGVDDPRSGKETMIHNRKQAAASGHQICNQMARIRKIAKSDRERAIITMLKDLTDVTDLALYMQNQTQALVRQVHEHPGQLQVEK